MISLWRAINKTQPRYPLLEKALEVDVVIVGGGITGITAAKQLIDLGKTVAVIDSYERGGVTTGSSTSIKNKFDLKTAKNVDQ